MTESPKPAAPSGGILGDALERYQRREAIFKQWLNSPNDEGPETENDGVKENGNGQI